MDFDLIETQMRNYSILIEDADISAAVWDASVAIKKLRAELAKQEYIAGRNQTSRQHHISKRHEAESEIATLRRKMSNVIVERNHAETERNELRAEISRLREGIRFVLDHSTDMSNRDSLNLEMYLKTKDSRP